MTGNEFASEMEEKVAALLEAARPLSEAWANKVWPRQQLIEVLKHYAYAEWRSCLHNAKHFLNTPMQQWDLKLGLAEQCHEEASHYEIERRKLLELGVDFDPAAYTPVPSWKRYFDNQENAPTALEKIAAENYGGEPKAVLFFKLAANGADPHLRDIAAPQIEDEEEHHEFGRAILEKYATTPEVQQRLRDISALQQKLSVDAMRELNERLGLPAPRTS
ncbi:MAG: ferritin-like domain-containing protein [Candidatus Tectomicrobia bacterium]|nr:ferritin-like domain-containing protein [Candidatus Tectomicrobia bacterium]